MQIIYSSKSGNTYKLALKIASELNEGAQDAASIGEIDSDFVVFGFWCDKGQIDECALALLPQLYGKYVAAFYTAGIPQDHEYVAKMNEQFSQQIREAGASLIAPIFMSQGAISDEIIAAMKELAAANPDDERHAITEEKKARWAQSKEHPNEQDMQAARSWAQQLPAAYKQLKAALEHMNADHLDSVEELVRAHTASTGAGAKLVAIDYEALGIEHEGGFISIPYTSPCTHDHSQLHMSVIKLCQQAKPEQKTNNLQSQMLEFRRSFASCVIASLRPDGSPLASYAPVIEHGGELYMFISEVAEHYEALAHNPLASVMFVQDEALAAMVFARVRLRYEVRAVILPRENEAANEPLFAALASAHPGAGVGMFQAMKDFHFVRLEILGGRYVKGFGAAYDIDSTGTLAAARVNNPHKRN